MSDRGAAQSTSRPSRRARPSPQSQGRQEQATKPRPKAPARPLPSRRAAQHVTRRAAEAHALGVVDDLTEVVSRFKPDGTFVFVNAAYCRFFGRTRRQLVGQRWQPRAVVSEVAMIEASLRTLSPANPLVVIENRVLDAQGEVRWMQFVNRAFFDGKGRHLQTQSTGRDITKRKAAEEALHRLNATLEQQVAERTAALRESESLVRTQYAELE